MSEIPGEEPEPKNLDDLVQYLSSAVFSRFTAPFIGYPAAKASDDLCNKSQCNISLKESLSPSTIGEVANCLNSGIAKE